MVLFTQRLRRFMPGRRISRLHCCNDLGLRLRISKMLEREELPTGINECFYIVKSSFPDDRQVIMQRGFRITHAPSEWRLPNPYPRTFSDCYIYLK